MNQEVKKNIDTTSATKAYINEIRNQIIDNQASKLFEDLKWIQLENISSNKSDLFPTVLTGKGNKILLIHGFDSCFLEYRRLIPILKKKNKLIIPDLYGFGFCPRSSGNKYGLSLIHI